MLVDVLVPHGLHQRARVLLSGLTEGAASFDCRTFREGAARPNAWLVLYGLGGSDRLPIAERHRAVGGRFLAFDAGYWQRTLPYNERKYRVSIDGFHCPKWIFRGERPSSKRWQQSGLELRQVAGSGPIILVGNGPKSVAVGAQGWTAKRSREVRKAFPGCTILYRPKPDRPFEPDVSHDGYAEGKIDYALRGAALVVCRHSNVAVDACRLGVPVVCEDGAAASIYPSELSNWQSQPSHAKREEFLHRLAWWQWSADECASGAFWRWFKNNIEGVS